MTTSCPCAPSKAPGPRVLLSTSVLRSMIADLNDLSSRLSDLLPPTTISNSTVTLQPVSVMQARLDGTPKHRLSDVTPRRVRARTERPGDSLENPIDVDGDVTSDDDTNVEVTNEDIDDALKLFPNI